MQRTQILLDPEQHEALAAIARRERRSLSSLVREMLEKQLEVKQQQALTKAAKALLPDYQEDPGLTAFTDLDGEEFHA